MGFSWDAHKKQVIGGAAALLAVGVLAASATALGGGKSDKPEAQASSAQYERPPEAVMGVQYTPTTAVAAQPADKPADKPAETSSTTQASRRTSSRSVRQGPTTTVVIPGREGYELRASIASQGGARAGQPVGFHIEVTGDAGKVDRVLVDFGDGTSGETPEPAALGCNRDRGPSNATFDMAHAYRSGGTFPVRITAIDVACGERVHFNQQPMMVQVAPGHVGTNGPSRPTISDCILNPNSFCVEPSSDHNARVLGQASDSDGYVSAVYVNWGDGQLEAIRFPLGECRQPADGWPSSQRAVSPQHHYPEAGSYTVTVTVESSGCSGADVQQSAFHKTVTVA